VTRPAPSSTWRCLTMAWRVTLAPPASAVAVSAPPEPSLRTTESRVGSPSAKKTPAARSGAADMFPEIVDLGGPSPFVHAERTLSPTSGDAIEARLDDGEAGPIRDRLQAKLDQRGRFMIGVSLGVDAVGDPAEAEVSLGLDALDGAEDRLAVGLPNLRGRQPQVLLMLDQRRFIQRAVERPLHPLSRREVLFQREPEPAPEFTRVGDGPPHAGDRRPEDHPLLDLIGRRHAQPPGCTLARPAP